MTSKTDMTRKRTGAEPMRADRPAIKRAAILLALGATLGLGAQAYGQTIRFDNPAGAGHFDWAADLVNGTDLDIILPASSQPNESRSSLDQRGDPSVGIGVVSGVPRMYVVNNLLVGLNAGAEIGSGITSWSRSGFITHPAIGQAFPQGVETYLAVRLESGQFAWIGVVRTETTLDVFAWGYEQTPGVSIAAGVPAPASVALLGLGCLVAARRRR